MPNIYVRHTNGTADADNGSTWALAKVSLTGAAAIDAAGDTIYLSQAHSESTAAAVTIALAGTVAAPVRVLAGNDAAEPPTALATAIVATTGASNIAVTGSGYIYGVTFTAGSSGAALLQLNKTPGGTVQFYENCKLQLGTGTTTSARIEIGPVSTVDSAQTTLSNCTFLFSSTSQFLVLSFSVHIRGGGLDATGPLITKLVDMFNQRGANILIEDFDASSAAQTVNLVGGGTTVGSAGRVVFRNCKLPASWSGSLVASAITLPGVRVEAYNIAAGDTNYALWIEDYAGSIRHETTIVRTGGASDGTTTLAWKMVSSSLANYPSNVLRSPEIVDWIDTTGASKTLTVEIAQDGGPANLNDDEVWLEVDYLGTSGFPLGVVASDAKANVLASAAAQTSSSETWGGTTPTRQKLSVTFTPQEKGFYIARVCLAKASTTVYVDPKVTVA